MSRGLAAFQKYIPTALVRTLVARGVEARLGGRQQILTVLFTDIVGFTGLSEQLGDAIVPVVSEYLELTSSAISAPNGTIDRFIGDAVMAFSGAPTPNDRHAVDACAAEGKMDIRETTIVRRHDITAMSLMGQKALVTGANSGIGKAVAIAMAKAGATDAVNYVVGDEQAHAVADQIRGFGGTATAVRADVADESQVADMFE